MSPNSHLNHLPIEYISLDNKIPLALLILGFLHLCLLHIILDWDKKIYSFFLGSESSSFQDQSVDVEEKKMKNQDSEWLKKKKRDESIIGEDIELVFGRLGLLLNHENDDCGKTFGERLDSNDLFDLFKEKEVSEDEVKATFDVFDENKDGFIDARELQRVLCGLGLREGSEVENCGRMITAFDENGDERIDFNEFVKFMESSFC